jgi:hypothetical protein
MPGLILHVGMVAMCPHAGQVSAIPSNMQVMVGGQNVVTVSDVFTIAGCPFMIGPNPHPCVLIKWVVPAARVKVNGQPILLTTSVGLCQAPDQAPQGPPNVVTTQTRATAT